MQAAQFATKRPKSRVTTAASHRFEAMREVVENVDVSELDDHVGPNMNPPNWRGMWFPPSGPLRRGDESLR
jgi:hypothetical protein